MKLYSIKVGNYVKCNYNIREYTIIYKLAKQPPSAPFPSPSGGAPFSVPQMVLTPGKKKKKLESWKPPPLAAIKKNWDAQMVLQLSQSHEDSEYVLSFEIGQRGSGFYSGRTNPTQYGISK